MTFMTRQKITLIFSITIVLISFSTHAQTLTLRTALEIPFFLESVTQINQKTPLVRKYYDNNKYKFPVHGALAEVNDQFILSQLSYSALFCSERIKKDLAKTPDQRILHQSVDSTLPPTSWSRRTLEMVFSDYAKIFWNRALTSDELNLLFVEFQNLSKALPDSANSSEIVLNVFCATFAASIPAIVH